MNADDIMRAVCAARGIAPSRLKCKLKTRELARARHEVMWLVREYLGIAYEDAARAAGRNDHTSALNGVAKVQRLVDADPAYGASLRALVQRTPRRQAEDTMREIQALRRELEARERRFLELVRGDERIGTPLSDEAGVGCGRAA